MMTTKNVFAGHGSENNPHRLKHPGEGRIRHLHSPKGHSGRHEERAHSNDQREAKTQRLSDDDRQN